MLIASEIRTILKEIRDIGNRVQTSGNEHLPGQIEDIKESVSIIEGNHSVFADEVFRRLESVKTDVETAITSSVKPLMERVTGLEARIDRIFSNDNADLSTPPNRKRSSRIPDFSVSFLKAAKHI